LSRPRKRKAAAILAVLGIGLAVGAPFILGSHQSLAGLRTVSVHMFLALAASAAASALGKAGKQHLMQTALGLRLPFMRTYAIALVTDSAFLVSPLGAAGYGVNIGLLQRSGASWATSTTVVGADQALDLAFLAVAVPIAIAFAVGPLAQVIPRANVSMIVGMLAGTAILIGTLWACRRKVASALDATCGSIQWVGTQRARWGKFRQSVRQQTGLLMAGPRHRFAGLLMFTALQWLTRYGVLWFVLLELGYRLPLGFVLAVQAVVLHAALWTGIPAGGAAGDRARAAAFANWVPQDAMATTLVLWRFATLYSPLMLGAVAFVALAWRRGLAMPATE
jgi:glycosyltransferase 2 family protein